MEDTLLMRRGVFASSNAELVERLAGVARAIEMEPASVDQAKRMLSLLTLGSEARHRICLQPSS